MGSLSAVGLRGAIEAGRIGAVVQPIIELHTRRVRRVEALARWTSPAIGPVLPSGFVPAAEHAGLIVPLTLCVANAVLPWLARARAHVPDLAVAVNVSPEALIDEDLAQKLLSLLRAVRLPASALVLEVTEGPIADIARAAGVLTAMRAAGIRIDADDFGSGHSTFARLAEIPLDGLKLDRLLTRPPVAERGVPPSAWHAIHLAHELGLEVVAEGVEDERTLELLRRAGCDMAQGYAICRPMPLSIAAAWISSRSLAVPAPSPGYSSSFAF